MSRKIILALVMAVLAGCGGGGGSGGSPSPSNLNPPSDNPGGGTTPDLQTGVFSDSPVAGLRFVQGNHSGYTDTQGQFTYDANQPAPVQFFIGDLYLGSARGAAVVTPFDLSINGAPVTLDAGINISRVLISLDSDNNPDNGITLTEGTRNANVQLEFGLASGQFEADPHVNYLIEQYAAGRTLESVADARAHLSQNAAAQQRIEQLEQAIESAISRIDIRWNSTLTSEGILAHYNASNGEELVLQLAEQDGALWIQRAIYAGPQGVSRLIEFSQDGNVAYVDNNGAVGKYVQIAEMDVIRFVENRDIYQPQTTAYLTTEAGLASAQQIHHFHQARINDIAAILQRQSEGQTGLQDQLLMGAHFMSLFNSVSCAGVAQCAENFLLSGALSRAMDDSHYHDATVTTHSEVLDDQLCLRSILNPVATPCLTNQTLAVLLLQSRNRVQAMKEREGSFVVRIQRFFSGELSSAPIKDRLFAVADQYYYGPWIEYQISFDTIVELVRLSDAEWLYTARLTEIEYERAKNCEVVWTQSVGRYQKSCTEEVPLAVAEGYRSLLHSEVALWLRHAAVYREMNSQPDGVTRFWCHPYSWDKNTAYKANSCEEDITSRFLPELIDHEMTAALEAVLQRPAGGIRVERFANQSGTLRFFPALYGDGWDLRSSLGYDIVHPVLGWLQANFVTR